MKYHNKLALIFLLVLIGCSPVLSVPTATPRATDTPTPNPTITPSPTLIPTIESVVMQNTLLFDCSDESENVAQLLKKDETVILRGKFKDMGIVSEYSGEKTICSMIPLKDLNIQADLLPELPAADFKSFEYGNALVEISSENAQHLGEVFSIGKGVIQKALFSPDSKFLAVTTPFGVHLYDGVTFDFVRFVETYADFIDFSLDGKLMYTASDFEENKKQVSVWNLSDGSQNSTISLGTNEIRSFFVSPDGQHFLSAGSGGVILWSVETGQQIKKITSNKESSFATFSEDGKYIAAGAPGIVQLYSADGSAIWENSFTGQQWTPSRTQITTPAIPQDIIFSPDNITVTVNGGVVEGDYLDQVTFRVDDGAQIKKHFGYPFTYSSTGQFRTYNGCGIVCITIIDSGSKENIRLFDPDQLFDDSLLQTSGSLVDVNFSPDSKYLVAASKNGTIQAWEMESYSLVKVILDFSMPIRHLSVSHDGGIIFSAESSRDYEYRADVTMKYDIWNESSMMLPRDQFIYDVAYSPNDDYVALLTNDKKGNITVNLINPGTLEVIKVFLATYGIANENLRISEDGSLIVASVDVPSSKVYVWDIEDPSQKLYEADRSMKSMQIISESIVSPDGDILIVEDSIDDANKKEYQLKLFDVQQKRNVGIIPFPNGIGSFEFLPHSNKLVVVFKNFEAGREEIQFWDTRALSQVSSSTQKIDWDFSDIVISPNGSLLALKTRQNEIKIYQIQNDITLLTTLTGHQNKITEFSFSGDGRFIVSGSEDGIIKIWAIKP